MTNTKKLAELKKESETRSRRVQLLITPKMHDKLKEIADQADTSVNQVIFKAIETFIEDL